MQTWKMNIINKLSEKAKDNKEINLYETAKELGYNKILIVDTQDIISGFLDLNHNFKVKRSNNIEQLTNSSRPYLFPTIIFTQLEHEELARLNNIAKIRRKRGYTQSKLAELSGLNIRMIQKYENGETDLKKAQVQTAMKISDALQVSLEDLIRC